VRCFSTTRNLLRGAVDPNVSNGELSEKAPQINTTTIEYNPKVLTKEVVNKTINSPFPVNVELNYYAPLRHEKRYGDLVAEVQFRAYNHENLDFLGDFALRAAYYLDIPVSGVFPLPTRRERWTVIRAPFVHAKSKENFMRLTHKRAIRAYDATPEVIDLWVSYIAKHSNSGVGIKVSTLQKEPIHLSEELDEIEISKLDKVSATLGGQNVTNTAVNKRVEEILNDPVFKRHLEHETIEDEPINDQQIEQK
jgi:small subunit ribosomal protein S10